MGNWDDAALARIIDEVARYYMMWARWPTVAELTKAMADAEKG